MRAVLGLILFFLLVIPVITSDSFSVELGGSSREADSKVTDNSIAKVDPKITEWQNSANLSQFAIDNNIPYENGKIAIYIYLDNSNSIPNIPSQIEITGSDQNIVVAKVSSEEINQLAQLDFVQKITLPVLVEPPTIPSTIPNDTDYSTILIIGVIIGIIVIVSLVIKFGVQRRKVYS